MISLIILIHFSKTICFFFFFDNKSMKLKLPFPILTAFINFLESVSCSEICFWSISIYVILRNYKRTELKNNHKKWWSCRLQFRIYRRFKYDVPYKRYRPYLIKSFFQDIVIIHEERILLSIWYWEKLTFSNAFDIRWYPVRNRVFVFWESIKLMIILSKLNTYIIRYLRTKFIQICYFRPNTLHFAIESCIIDSSLSQGVFSDKLSWRVILLF